MTTLHAHTSTDTGRERRRAALAGEMAPLWGQAAAEVERVCLQGTDARARRTLYERARTLAQLTWPQLVNSLKGWSSEEVARWGPTFWASTASMLILEELLDGEQGLDHGSRGQLVRACADRALHSPQRAHAGPWATYQIHTLLAGRALALHTAHGTSQHLAATPAADSRTVH